MKKQNASEWAFPYRWSTQNIQGKSSLEFCMPTVRSNQTVNELPVYYDQEVWWPILLAVTRAIL